MDSESKRRGKVALGVVTISLAMLATLATLHLSNWQAFWKSRPAADPLVTSRGPFSSSHVND